MNHERFRFFSSIYLESDLLVGVPHAVFHEEMPEKVVAEIIRIRKVLDFCLELIPSFKNSREPISPDQISQRYETVGEVPSEIATMVQCSVSSSTGPMSTVAGLFAQYVGHFLKDEYNVAEVVVENGGDLYLSVENEAVSVIHAGDSPLSDRLGFRVKPGNWGICTSSGTMGHSYSRGRADAVTVISHSAPMADAWATALANQIFHAGDIEKVMDRVARQPEVLACAAIVDDRIGIRGDFEVKTLY
jgi:ApbE superfamily uncharacterized protein (UPF0280 family)